ncbi:MAG: hypothetical protein QNJ36_05550 [Calothrix sp. MO_167.B42]|nr:hypothetical protein [Calothrix sp. MO_167.B42]
MPLLEYPELLITQIILIVVSGIWLLRRNDEIPLLSSTFLFYVASYRYWVVTSGIGRWVNSGSFVGITAITDDAALIALSYIVFGEICLLTAYMLRQRRVLPVLIPAGDRFLFSWLHPKVIFFGLFCLPLVVVTRSSVIAQINAGRSLAFEVSGYLYLFPMVLVGIAILILCLWKFGGLPTLQTKIAAILIMIGVSFFTFTPHSRFQFLGWIIASGIILSSSYVPKTRLIIFACLAIIGLGIFSVAGAMRNTQLTENSLNQAALERTFSAEDANMLDGFVFIQEIYPKRLDFAFGMEHLEILLRPIPRALWPEKPVGGYVNKLGLYKSNSGGTLGISPTLFGSFYAEGGIISIFFFSLLYGAILAAIVRYSTNLQPFASILVRAILGASMIPLLRGGDLPGIYAWFGMAFWPCFLLLWLKRKYFRLKLPPSIHFHQSNEIIDTKYPNSN